MSTKKKKPSTAGSANAPAAPRPSLVAALFGWVPAVLKFSAAVLNAAGKIAVVGFFTRYWLLLAVLVVLVAVVFSGLVYATVGAMVWLPAVGVGGWAFVLLVINIFFRRTIDQDIDSGRFADEWDKVSPTVRLSLTVATTLVLFLGYCLIAAGLASR